MEEIIEGDCLDVLPRLRGRWFDAVMADPPYSSGGAFRDDRMKDTTEKYVQGGVEVERLNFQGDNRDQRAYLLWCALWLGMCLRLTRPGGIIFLFTDWRQLPTTTDAMQLGGWIWRGIIPWNKTEAARPQPGRFRAQCEYVIWGSNGPIETGGRSPLPGFYTYPVLQADKFHLTGKPTSLYIDMMGMLPAGAVVLDPFCGSGTTLVAAKQTGRAAVGIEISPEYCAVARARVDGTNPSLLLERRREQAARQGSLVECAGGAG